MSKRSLELPTERDEKKRVRRIDARSKEGIEASEKLFLEVTTKGRKILPDNEKKYSGCIFPCNKSSWSVDIITTKFTVRKSFRSKEEALKFHKEVNIRENLIKNIIYVLDDQYYCVLTQNQVMKFSFSDIGIVDSHTWSVAYLPSVKSFYATTSCTDDGLLYKSKLFHRFVLPDTDGKTADHINQETLDNNNGNLRLATRITQATNRDIMSNNTSGYTGVQHFYEKYWVAKWKENNKWRSKGFPVSKYGDDAKTMAIDLLKQMDLSEDTTSVLFRLRDEWVASWSDENLISRTKTFSVLKYGEAAETLALAHRKEIETSLEKYREALCLDAKK